MLILALAAAIVGQSAPAAAAEWWLVEVKRPPVSDLTGAIYADAKSVVSSGEIKRFAGTAIREGPVGGVARADYQMQIRCATNEIRAASAQLFDAAGGRLARIDNPKGFVPIEGGTMQGFARLICTSDRQGLTLVPEGVSTQVHAARIFAEASLAPPPLPPHPPETAEEIARTQEMMRRMRQDRLESSMRSDLADSCRSALDCRDFEGRITPGTVAIDTPVCVEIRGQPEPMRSCRFVARHLASGRTVSCSVEEHETTWEHGTVWTPRRRPAPRPEPPSPGIMVPSISLPGPSTLACTGSIASLASP
ncbi:MAG TPA: hypothetical protein VGB65_04360 [Allosphingosinicella sp.]|jgi:hypothetical protein